MYHYYKPYPCPYINPSAYPAQASNQYAVHPYYHPGQESTDYAEAEHHHNPHREHHHDQHRMKLKDYGPEPYVVNIEKATKQNDNFRTALWTGEYLQLTLMSIDVGDDIGLEIHHDHDQFIRIEEGEGIVQMGDKKHQLDYYRKVSDDYAIFIPAGKWHNLTNTGRRPLKLYSIYAPPEHPRGTVHKTKRDAEKHHR
ncbi:cupin domain-containing protein [Desulfuribacillus alkaliarsenatis]|nr:cupin domain-containing protein [Desulfuribacillus alkaliarsenatis]